MNLTSDLCIILPAFNEGDTIIPCLRELQGVFLHATLLVVDNASSDDTATKARACGATVIHEKQPGKGYAVTMGVDWALRNGFKWIALHDADNEYSAYGLYGLYDLVTRSRAILRDQTTPENEPLIMGVGLREVGLGAVLWRSLAANWIARKALHLATKGDPPLDVLTGARVFNAGCARKLFAEPTIQGFELETALTRRAMTAEVSIICAPVRYTPRDVTLKKIRAFDLLPILKSAWRA